MNISISFEKMDTLVRIINFLENENVEAALDYNKYIQTPQIHNAFKKRFFDKLIQENDENLEIILNDMGKNEARFFPYLRLL